MRYEGIACPVCEKEFTENDDVVVCPDCGTPHHRECWNSCGHCINYLQHGGDFSWQMPEKPATEPDIVEAADIVCPSCGHRNPAGSPSCDACGQRFTIFGVNVFDAQNKINEQDEKEKRIKHGDAQSSYPPPFQTGTVEDLFGGAQPQQNEQGITADGAQQNEQGGSADYDAPETDGVKLDDITEYVRVNHLTYLRKFKKLDDGKRVSWSWAAFIFSPFWFFYRKMIKPGIVFLTAAICLNIAFTQPINEFYDKYAKLSEIITSQEVADAQFEQAMSAVEKTLPMMLIYMGATVLLHIISALLADRLYKKKAVRDIKKLRSEPLDNQSFHLAMFRAGGVSYTFVLIAIAAEYVVQTAAAFIIN